MCIRDSAYINHDIDDAIRARMFVEEDLPECYTEVLGHSVRERLNNLIHDIIRNSYEKPEIIMSPHMEDCLLYTSLILHLTVNNP